MIAGSWLIASVCIERMMQMSSTISAVCGKSSLSHAPLWPCRANLKIDGATGKLFWPEVIVVIRWPIRTESGSSMPAPAWRSPACSRKVHLRRRARLEQVDHPLDLGREVRQARQAARWRPLAELRCRRRAAGRRGPAVARRAASRGPSRPGRRPSCLRKTRRFDLLRPACSVVHGRDLGASAFIRA